MDSGERERRNTDAFKIRHPRRILLIPSTAQVNDASCLEKIAPPSFNTHSISGNTETVIFRPHNEKDKNKKDTTLA